MYWLSVGSVSPPARPIAGICSCLSAVTAIPVSWVEAGAGANKFASLMLDG